MAIVSRPTTQAYRDNWPFEEKPESRETRADSDTSLDDLALQLMSVVFEKTFTLHDWAKRLSEPARDSWRRGVAFLKSIKIEGADK